MMVPLGILEILKRHYGKDLLEPEALASLEDRNTTFESLKSDSLDLLELGIDAEDVYDIDLVHEDPRQLKTIGDFVALIERAIERKKNAEA